MFSHFRLHRAASVLFVDFLNLTDEFIGIFNNTGVNEENFPFIRCENGKRGPRFSDLFMDFKVNIGKKGKRDPQICLEGLNLSLIVPRAYAYHFYVFVQCRVLPDNFVYLVCSRGLFMADGAVKTEEFDQD